MKLILPIAGVGQRLRPFTFSKPKGFLKIGGHRVVDHILDKISNSVPELCPLAVVCGYMGRQIIEYLDKTCNNRFSINYVDQKPKGYLGDIPYFGGLGEAVLLTKAWFDDVSATKSAPCYGKLQPNDTMIFLGDMIPVKDYDATLSLLEEPEIDGVIGVMKVSPEKTRFYGIVEADESGAIQSMVEKPQKTNSDLAIAGVYAFKEKAMKRLYAILDANNKAHLAEDSTGKMELQLTPALQQLVEEGFKIHPHVFTEGILDFGRPEALLYGNRKLLDANHSAPAGNIGEISNTVVQNPCAVGTETTIRRSVIGPYVSVGNNCVIENCNLDNVVVGDNCVLRNIISTNSIIGDFVEIESIIRNQIILGDHSCVIEAKIGSQHK